MGATDSGKTRTTGARTSGPQNGPGNSDPVGQSVGINWPQRVRVSANANHSGPGAADSRGRRGADPPGGGPCARASGPDGITDKFLFFENRNPRTQWVTAPPSYTTPTFRGSITATMDTMTHQSVGADVTPLPDWLTAGEPPAPATSKPVKALVLQQFEAVFPRTLELISSGYTLTAAVQELPIDIDTGAFLRWIKRDHMRAEAYKEAKEIRTEAWAGKLVEYAEAADTAEDVQRSKLKVDTLKWLMAADNRRTYGDVKQVELGGSISITAALAAANQRVIEAEIIEAVEPLQLENDDE